MAEPTIFGEGALIGSKTVQMHALDPFSGKVIYRQDTSSADCADEACMPTDQAPDTGEAGQLLVSRADYSVRVLDKRRGSNGGTSRSRSTLGS